MSLLNFCLPTSFFERRILLSDFLLPVPKDSVEKSRRALFFVLRENGDALLCVKTFSTYVIFGHRRESYAFGFSGI
mgnify:FL=1